MPGLPGNSFRHLEQPCSAAQDRNPQTFLAAAKSQATDNNKHLIGISYVELHEDTIIITPFCSWMSSDTSGSRKVFMWSFGSWCPGNIPIVKTFSFLKRYYNINQLIQPLSEVEQTDRLSHEEELVPYIPSSNTISQSPPLSSPSFLSLPIECGGTHIFIP